jgi:hypothetical protein
MQSLWDFLVANGADPAASGWTNLYGAGGVSLDGTVIVGGGLRNGNGEAFLAVIPEPAALPYVAASIGTLACRIRTRRPA